MKLLEITRSFYPSIGGLEKFVNNRLNIYKTLGIEFTLLSTDYSNEKRDGTLRNEKVIYLNQHTPYNYTPVISDYFSEDYDIISVNQIGRYFSDKAIYHYSKKGKKIILTPHLSFHTSRYKIIKELYIRFVIKKLLACCTNIICLTEYERKYWREIHNVSPDKLIVIPHYYDSGGCDMNEPAVDEKYFFYLGRAGNNKKTDLLIDAFHLASLKDYRLKLTIEGTDLSPKSRKIVAQDGRIELLGYISEIEKNRCLNKCSAVIYPSQYEAFGYVLLEASGCKKPILCSNLEVFREILDPEGVIFFDNTLESISNALTEFSQKENIEKDRMGTLNFNNLKKYSFPHVVEKYRELFGALLL